MKCEHNDIITCDTLHIYNLEAGEEPYKNGIYEEISKQDQELIYSKEFTLGVGICKNCGKVFIYPDKDLQIVQ